MFEDAQKPQATEIAKLGEFGLIEKLAAIKGYSQPNTLKGIGDDAAVIDAGDGTVWLYSTDMLAEGVHFNLMYTPYKHLGYKSAVVNFSDIYAMNGNPTHLLVSLGVSAKISVEALEEFYTGLQMACLAYGVELIGGDTSTTQAGMVVSLTVIGKAEKKHVAYRSGAKEHDLICVSGNLGAAYLGLQILEREKDIFFENPGIQPDLSGFEYVLERQLKPEARKDIVTWLQENAILPSAMIDVSDGLSSEILHLCKASSAGCRLYEEKIPIDPASLTAAEELSIHPVTCALNGGEDYELLFTIRQSDVEKIKQHADIHIIGHICDAQSGTSLVTQANELIPLQAGGWNSLKT